MRVIIFAVAVLLPVLNVAADDHALITFSTLGNTNIYPNPQTAIPADYQPLTVDYQQPAQFSKDGANLGISIIWGDKAAGAKLDAIQPAVGPDHTADKADAVMFGFGATTFSMTFSQPVTIPSLFWTFYRGGPQNGKIAVYEKAGDAMPLTSVDLSSSDPAGYTWHELVDLAKYKITKIEFTGTTEALNIDDITVVKASEGSNPAPAAAPVSTWKQPADHPFIVPLFCDNMVLQRDQPDPVWGWTKPGETVTVTIADQKTTAIAGDDGKWMAKITPPAAGGPYQMEISGLQNVSLKNVLVGDVWICSGQSNMAFGMTKTKDAEQEIANANQPQIRLFLLANNLALSPIDTFQGQWQLCTPDTVKVGGWGGFSAVGYFFGRELQQDLKVPIGLIETAWGGTPAESWTSRQALTQKVLDFNPILDQETQVDALVKAGTYNREKQIDDWYQANGIGVEASSADFDASAWKTMPLPKMWQQSGDPQLAHFLGVVWFRKEINLPPESDGKTAELDFGQIENSDFTWVNGVQVGTSWGGGPRKYKIPAGALKAGKNLIAVRVLTVAGPAGLLGTPDQMALTVADSPPLSLAGDWQYNPVIALDKTTPRLFLVNNNPNIATEIFNAMVSPLIPFGIKGAIWYQGEANVGRGFQYRTLLPTMIDDWRTRWQQGNFPFLLVQLANLGQVPTQPGESNWAEVREAQALTAQKDPNVGLSTAIDIGNPADIHPTNKQEVGRRLGLVARAQVYQEPISFSGPLYQSMKVEGSGIRVTFAHADGLVAKDDPAIKGFEISGDDHHFYWADAKIDGDSVIVSSSQVTTPVAVRYDWADNPPGNLYNKDELPTFPFRTDDWPEVSLNAK